MYTGLLRVRASGDRSSYASKHQRVGKKRKILPHSGLRQCAFCPLALFTPAGVAVAGSRQYQSLVLRLLLLLGAPQILLDLLQTRHGPVDGGRINQVKVVHVDQMQEEVSTQVAADDVSAAVLGEQHDGLVHLVVCYETKEKNGPGFIPAFKHLLCVVILASSGRSNVPVLHDVQVPQLHHLLLSLVDVCELV